MIGFEELDEICQAGVEPGAVAPFHEPREVLASFRQVTGVRDLRRPPPPRFFNAFQPGNVLKKEEAENLLGPGQLRHDRRLSDPNCCGPCLLTAPGKLPPQCRDGVWVGILRCLGRSQQPA